MSIFRKDSRDAIKKIENEIFWLDRQGYDVSIKIDQKVLKGGRRDCSIKVKVGRLQKISG